MNDIKQIVIAGISGDLGAVLARELSVDSEVSIIGTMRRSKKLGETFPKNIHIVDCCDLMQPKCCAQVALVASELFNGRFGYIHSVGDFVEHAPFLSIKSDQANRIFESNTTTFYNAMQAMIPVMKSNGGGSSIAFSCNSVTHNYPWMASFTAAKSALDSLVRTLAHEFAGDSLCFNSLVLSSLKMEKEKLSKPHGDFDNFIPPTDLLPIIKFLLSQDSYLVNGNSISLYQYSENFYHTGYFERVSK